MGKINYGRVVLGGLLAGVVINAGEYVLNEIVLGEQLAAAMAGLNLPAIGTEQIMKFVAITFVLGIVLVWIYAAIRPRFGAGVKTAIIAGVVTWLVGSCLPTTSMVIMGVLPAHLAALGCLWGLVEITIASIAGAWLYKENA